MRRTLPAGRSFGDGPKCPRRVLVTVADEGSEAGRNHRSFVDRGVVTFLEVAQQPARGHARMPARILARDQDRQLERVDQVEPGGAPLPSPRRRAGSRARVRGGRPRADGPARSTLLPPGAGRHAESTRACLTFESRRSRGEASRFCGLPGPDPVLCGRGWAGAPARSSPLQARASAATVGTTGGRTQAFCPEVELVIHVFRQTASRDGRATGARRDHERRTPPRCAAEARTLS
jgi:hypothetical protein